MRRILTITAAVMFSVVFATAGVAGAQYPGNPPADGGGNPPAVDVEGDDVGSRPDGVGAGEEVLGDVTTRPASVRGGLPVTGGDLVGLTVLGLGAIGAGAALVTYRRRRLA